MVKKITTLILSALLILCTLSGCTPKSEKNEKINIVCSTFPQYDWVKQILGENAGSVNLTLLVKNGTDLHNYQPSVKDIMTIGSCDMFIYVGGNSESWVEDALRQAPNKNLKVINLMEILEDKIKEETVAEGMEAHEEEEHAHSEIEYDEHIWLSVKNAVSACNYICDELCAIDGENTDIYKKNTAQYTDKLNELDVQYTSAVETAKRKTLIFADRFPFRYLTDDYNLTYYAAFPGCSAETEASFETIVFLAKKADSENVPVLLTIEGSNSSIAKTVKESSTAKNQKILSLNSLQSVTSQEVEGGLTYLSVMTDNLSVIKEALN